MVVWKQARQKFLGRYAYYLKIVLFLFNKIFNDILICIIDCKLEISKVIRLDHKVWYLEPNFVASLGLNQFCKRSAGPVKRIWLKSVSVYIMAQWQFWSKLLSFHYPTGIAWFSKKVKIHLYDQKKTRKNSMIFLDFSSFYKCFKI